MEKVLLSYLYSTCMLRLYSISPSYTGTKLEQTVAFVVSWDVTIYCIEVKNTPTNQVRSIKRDYCDYKEIRSIINGSQSITVHSWQLHLISNISLYIVKLKRLTDYGTVLPDCS